MAGATIKPTEADIARKSVKCIHFEIDKLSALPLSRNGWPSAQEIDPNAGNLLRLRDY